MQKYYYNYAKWFVHEKVIGESWNARETKCDSWEPTVLGLVQKINGREREPGRNHLKK